MIGYCYNHLDGQLNCQASAHWLIGVTIMYWLCNWWLGPSTQQKSLRLWSWTHKLRGTSLQPWTWQSKKLRGHVRRWGSPLSVSHPTEAYIPTAMGPMHVNVNDAKQVYCCQAKGCPEGLLSSHATICAHVCHTHLYMKLSCPFCLVTFLILTPSSGMANRHITLCFLP